MVASTLAEITWVKNLLMKLDIILSQSPIIYCDNLGVTYLCHNPIFHSKMKHIVVDFYFVWKKIQNQKLIVTHISTPYQLAHSNEITFQILISILSHQARLLFDIIYLERVYYHM